MEKQSDVIDVKIEYCRKCGSSLDSTRRCIGCGKQYFFIRKSKILQLYAGIMTALSIFLVYNQYQTNQTGSSDAFQYLDEPEPDFSMSELDSIIAILKNPSFAEDRRLNPSYTSYDKTRGENVTTTLFETEPAEKNFRRIFENYQKHLDITVEANNLSPASDSYTFIVDKELSVLAEYTECSLCFD